MTLHEFRKKIDMLDDRHKDKNLEVLIETADVSIGPTSACPAKCAFSGID